MVKISIYRSKTKKEELVEVREVSSDVALNEMISALYYRGFIEEKILICVDGDSKADTSRIAVTTHLLGPVMTPYLMVFEGLLETDMSFLGIVVEWFVKATNSASDEVLRKILS
jgi:hypothetical protein